MMAPMNNMCEITVRVRVRWRQGGDGMGRERKRSEVPTRGIKIECYFESAIILSTVGVRRNTYDERTYLTY